MGWINKLWLYHMMKYYSPVKINPSYMQTAWMNVKNVEQKAQKNKNHKNIYDLPFK